MARIKLIVTGDMEKLALRESLQSFFPGERRDEDEVIWDLPRKVSGATSYKLVPGAPPSGPMLTLADAMLAEALSGKKGRPADLVVLVDDVEIGNVGQEGVIAEHFRAAMNQRLGAHDATTQTRYRDLVRERCCFFLLNPMVEAYLFGDTGALCVAGVPAGETPRLVHPSDVEQFQTDDPLWLPTCLAENLRRAQATPWWCHERHAKRYLEHLTGRGGVFYEETDHGKRALSGLQWNQVAGTATDTPLLRSLFEDLADWFGVPNPLGPGALHPGFYPPRSVNRASLLLRNM